MPGFNPFDVTTKRVLNKLGGDKISAKKYTFDGNTEGRIVLPFSQYWSFVKISNEMPDLQKMEYLTISFERGGEQSVETDSFVIQDVKLGDNTLYGAVGAVALRDDSPIAVVITDTASSPIPETGFYVYMQSDGTEWISSVEFAATIVPIDQKYLGGVCLPVVELSTAPTAEGAALTAEESAKMDALKGSPCLLTVFFEGMPYTGVSFVVHPGDGVLGYYLSTPFGDLYGISNDGGTWKIASMS